MALFRSKNGIERAMFVVLALFPHMKGRCLGEGKSAETFLSHCYIATLERKIFEGGKLTKALFVLTTQSCHLKGGCLRWSSIYNHSHTLFLLLARHHQKVLLIDAKH